MVVTGEQTVLVVEDETAIGDQFASWLRERYRVRLAHDRTTATTYLDDSLDVALLDRRLPDGSGEDVLAEIREQGLDCRVAMVSALEPDFDVLELGYDTYVVKPISKPETLYDTVEQLLRRSTYDEQIQRLLSLSSKCADLEDRIHVGELEGNEEYQGLVEEIDSIRTALSTTMGDLGDEDFRAEFSEPVEGE